MKMVDSHAGRRQALGVLGFVVASALIAATTVVTLQKPRRVELAGSVDWDAVPERRPLPADWAGVSGEDGRVHPATCGQICSLCHSGALRGNAQPGSFMEGESCQLCQCERAQLPVWDSWNMYGECSPELCFACESGKLEGKSCMECACGAFTGHKLLEDVCRHRDQTCYSCMVGTLLGSSCERCMCGWWNGARRQQGETAFGAHECATTCRACSIGAQEGVECDLCFCPVYHLQPLAAEPEPYVPEGEGMADVLDGYRERLAKSKAALEEHIKALQDHQTPEVPAADAQEEDQQEEEEEEEEEPWALPHYAWMEQ